jgi:hypothetical protein
MRRDNVSSDEREEPNMPAVRRIGAPREAKDEPLVGVRIIEVPIEGDYASEPRWENAFRQGVQERLNSRQSLQNIDRFMNALRVESSRITFQLRGQDLEALPYFLEAIDHALPRANELEERDQGLDKEAADRMKERREAEQAKFDEALEGWAREHPPPS